MNDIFEDAPPNYNNGSISNKKHLLLIMPNLHVKVK